MWRNDDIMTDEEPLDKYIVGRMFIPFSIGALVVEIHQEMRKL